MIGMMQSKKYATSKLQVKSVFAANFTDGKYLKESPPYTPPAKI
jgi:hypothetical protein